MVEKLKQFICKIFGHKKSVYAWYHEGKMLYVCKRCKKIIENEYLTEGPQKKGGVNKYPTTLRPQDKPKGHK